MLASEVVLGWLTLGRGSVGYGHGSSASTFCPFNIKAECFFTSWDGRGRVLGSLAVLPRCLWSEWVHYPVMWVYPVCSNV